MKNIDVTFLFVLMLLMASKNTLAEEVASEDPPAENRANVCHDVKSEGEAWFDDVQRYLSVQFCQPAFWFDSFFSDPRVDEEPRAGTSVRWQNDYTLTKGGTWTYSANVNASFKLPKAKKSLHIVFEGDEEESLRDVLPADREQAKGDFGLLYAITRSDRVDFSVRLKLSPSITFRYRYLWPLTDTFETRFTQELYRRDNADGRTSRLDFEQKFYENFLLRQSNSVSQSESFIGEKWSHSLVLYQRLTEKSALSYESSVARVTAPETFTTNTRLGVRFRQNIFRKWLFYEIAPAYNWPRPLVTDARERAWEILFRLEVNFINF